MQRILRCKMRVEGVTLYTRPDGTVESETVKLWAVVGDTDENKDWSRWTPAADFSITISNPRAFGSLTKDREFYVDFTPVLTECA